MEGYGRIWKDMEGYSTRHENQDIAICFRAAFLPEDRFPGEGSTWFWVNGHSSKTGFPCHKIGPGPV
jgi:hypothetical protein